MRSIVIKTTIIFALLVCFLTPTLIQPPKAHAWILEACMVVAEICIVVAKEVAKDQAKKAAQNAINAAMKRTMAETLMDLVSKHDYLSAIGILSIMFLKWIADLLHLVNNTVFSFAFADLTVLFDYGMMVRHGTDAGKQIGKLYDTLAVMAISLASFFFILNQGFLVFKLMVKKAWGDVFSPILKIFATLLLINFFPTIFSLSVSLTATICDKILAVHVPGEIMKHAPTGQVLGNVQNGLFSSAGTGLDLLADKVDTYLAMPEAVVKKAETTANNYVNNTADAIVNTFNAWVDGTVNKALDSTVDKGIDAIASNIGMETNSTSSSSSGSNSNTVKQGIDSDLVKASISYIFSSIMEITSLMLIVSILALKGLQMAALLILYIAAPIGLAFFALPTKENLGLKFLTTVWGILGWNIFWAIALKVYFIVTLIVNGAIDSSGVLSQLGIGGIIPFAGAFFRLGVLLAMLAVTSWVGIIAVTSVAHSVGSAASMAGGFLSLGKAGSIISQPINMAKNAVSTTAGGVGKVMGFVQDPAKALQTHGSNFMTMADRSFQAHVDSGSGKATRERLMTEETQKSRNQKNYNAADSSKKLPRG
jgi:hypothetical protein